MSGVNIIHKEQNKPINIKRTYNEYKELHIENSKKNLDNYQNVKIDNVIDKIIEIEQTLTTYNFPHIIELLDQLLVRVNTLENDVSSLKNREYIHVGTTEGPHDEKTLWFEIL